MVKISSYRGLKTILGTFDNLPFNENEFDAVWSYTTLLHIPKNMVSVPLKEIYRILPPSGIFAPGLIEGNTEEHKESSGVNLPRWFSFYTKEEVVELLQKQGFELIYFETFKPRTRKYLNFIFKRA